MAGLDCLLTSTALSPKYCLYKLKAFKLCDQHQQ